MPPLDVVYTSDLTILINLLMNAWNIRTTAIYSDTLYLLVIYSDTPQAASPSDPCEPNERDLFLLTINHHHPSKLQAKKRVSQ